MPIFKIGFSLNISFFSEPFLSYNNCNVHVGSFFSCFGQFQCLTQTVHFAKTIAFCMVAIFAKFQNRLICRILAAFYSRFLHKTTVMCFYSRLCMFFTLLMFDPNCPFCEGYSLCMVAIFANFQNRLIFRITSVFLNRFFYTTTVMCF